MNQRIGMYSAISNASFVFIFALSLLLGSDYISYLSSMFIAFSFVLMSCSFAYYSPKEAKVAGYAGMAFSAIYATLIIIVYFAQLTAVYHGQLSSDVLPIIDYAQFGLFFSYNLLGYGLMALSTFMIGLTIQGTSGALRWLKRLLLIHGIFFVSGLVIPLMGIFNSETQGADWIGTAILMFWCIYFVPVGILSYVYFKQDQISFGAPSQQ